MKQVLLRGIWGATVVSLVALGAGCTSEDEAGDPSGGIIEHPIENRIPRHEQAVSITKEQRLTELSDPPPELQTLASFLADPGSVDTTRVNILVEESRRIEIASPSPNRLVVLSGHPENKLFEHNLRTGTTTQIARAGEGPGELKFAEAVTRRDSSVYVARQDRRIDRFDCADPPCTYEESIRLRFSPMAITATGPHLAVAGIPLPSSKGPKIEDWSGAIQMLGPDGMIEQAFGQAYQTEHFLVLSNYVRSSSLVFSGMLDQLVRASSKLPLIWAYAPDGTPEIAWTIEDFEPLPLEYDSSERSIHKRYEESYSTLRLQGPLDGRFVVATVRHTNYSSAGSGLHLAGVDYYALDLKTGASYYLGRDTPREGIVDRLFLMTDEHQVLIENGHVSVITGHSHLQGSGNQARTASLPEPTES